MSANKIILSRLKSYQRRLRRLLICETALILLMGVGFASIAGALWFSYLKSLEGGLVSIITLLLIGILSASFWVMRGWKHTSMHSQVSRAEKRREQLRGRLFLAAEDLAQGGSSTSMSRFQRELRDRAAKRCSEVLNGLSSKEVHSSHHLHRFGKQVAAITFLVFGAHLLLPVGPFQALAVLRPASTMSPVIELSQVDEEIEVVVGDIHLRYVFPEYTQMTPIEIPNSDGSVRAPPGTVVEISARSLEKMDGVALQVGGNEPVSAELIGGRNIRARFVVDESNGIADPAVEQESNEQQVVGGSGQPVLQLDSAERGWYRFLFTSSNRTLTSKRFSIHLDDDDPPVVTIDVPRPTVPSNRSLQFSWTAADDFGLERVLLEVETKSDRTSFLLRKPQENRLELQAKLRRAMSELGLQAGDKAKIRVVAYDNQAPVSSDGAQESLAEADQPFGKRGESVWVDIEVLSPQMAAERLRELNRQLRDVMVPILADFLVDRLPQSGRRAKTRKMVSWSISARKRFDPLQVLIKDAWGNQPPKLLTVELVQAVTEQSGKLIRFVLTTFGEGRVGKPRVQDTETFLELHAEQVFTLEQAISIIDLMLRRVAMSEIASKSSTLESSANRLIQQDWEAAEASQLQVGLEQSARQLKALKDPSEELSDSTMKQFIEARTNELQRQLEQVQQALKDAQEASASSQQRAEKMSDAKAEMASFAESMKQFSEGMQDQLERMKSEQDELQQQLESLIEKLEKLETEQRDLAEELALGRSQDSEQGQSAASLWKKAQEQADSISNNASTITSRTGDGEGMRTGSIRQVERFRESALRLRSAIQARELKPAQDNLPFVYRRQYALRSVLSTESSRGRPASDPKPAALPEMLSLAKETEQELLGLSETLDQLSQLQYQESPDMQQLAQSLRQEEQNFLNRMKQLSKEVKQVEQQLPTADGSASKAANEATQSMTITELTLEEGRAMAGEGYSRESADAVRRTREALEQAMQQMQQMQQQMQQMSGQQGGSGPGSGEEQDGASTSSIEIPLPEEFIAPEEYRRLLLLGMTGDVPEEYRAMKQRYYEELVTQ